MAPQRAPSHGHAKIEFGAEWGVPSFLCESAFPRQQCFWLCLEGSEALWPTTTTEASSLPSFALLYIIQANETH